MFFIVIVITVSNVKDKIRVKINVLLVPNAIVYPQGDPGWFVPV